jgi:23S rRNA (uracil747-C5)-methyltransferase
MQKTQKKIDIETMKCAYHEQQICNSCTLLGLEYNLTLQQKTQALATLFPDVAIGAFRGVSSPQGGRIRARLAVSGSLDNLQIGFFDDQQKVVPVDQCPLHHVLINDSIARIRQMIQTARLAPYDPGSDRGELKFVVLTCSPSHQQLMIQFVLRSKESVDRIRSLWRKMTEAERHGIAVMSINIQPARSSAISGREEVVVSEQTMLPIRFDAGNNVNRDLLFGPQSFLQTNYEIASALYAAARGMIQSSEAKRVLDLYCGVGAFSLTACSTEQSVVGIDISENAIACANETVRRSGLSHAEFQCRSLDCTSADQLTNSDFDTIICNPPRRGLDAASRALIFAIHPQQVLYSSCNPATLQRDIAELAGKYQLVELYPFDMFPFTTHFEVLALLQRKAVRSW